MTVEALSRVPINVALLGKSHFIIFIIKNVKRKMFIPVRVKWLREPSVLMATVVTP